MVRQITSRQTDEDTMSDPKEKTHVIEFRFDRDPKVKLRGGARREPTTPTGTYRIWQPPAEEPSKPEVLAT